jgi:hypothetical protein
LNFSVFYYEILARYITFLCDLCGLVCAYIVSRESFLLIVRTRHATLPSKHLMTPLQNLILSTKSPTRILLLSCSCSVITLLCGLVIRQKRMPLQKKAREKLKANEGVERVCL